MIEEIGPDRWMQLDEGPFVVFERARFLQNGIGHANLAEIVQRCRVEDKVRVCSVPPEVLRQHSAVVAQSDVVVCGLVIFVSNGLVQTLRRVEVRLRELSRILLLALERLLKFSGVEQQLTVSGGELFGAFALCVQQLAKILRVQIKLRLAGSEHIATLTMHGPLSG